MSLLSRPVLTDFLQYVLILISVAFLQVTLCVDILYFIMSYCSNLVCWMFYYFPISVFELFLLDIT